MLLEKSKNDFYKEFEDQFRGSKDDIYKRLSYYRAIIEYLNTIEDHTLVADLGCGRGEWVNYILQNTSRTGVIAVDLNKSMINEIKADHRVNIIISDALEFLSNQKDNSLDLITSFHMIEHISDLDFHNLVRESYRVLKDKGVLLIETPNPENLRVSAEYFYIDPTHIKPIPSVYTQFVIQYYGFKRSNIVRVNSDLLKKNTSTIDMLWDVSPDYAVVAQKNTSNNQVLDELFSGVHGRSMDDVMRGLEKLENKKNKVLEDNFIKLDNISLELYRLNGELNRMKSSIIYKVCKWLKLI